MPPARPYTTTAITWQDPAADADGFDILIAGNAHSVSGTTYGYSRTVYYQTYGVCAQVRAANAAGDSAWASVDCGSTSGSGTYTLPSLSPSF